MKKQFITLLAIATSLLLSACVADSNENVTQSQSLQLSLAFDSSRIAFDDHKYVWEGDETLGIYTSSATPAVNLATEVAVVDGCGVCSPSLSYSNGDVLYAYYPYSRGNSNTPSQVALTIPDEQLQSEAGVFNVANMPMVATPLTLSLASTRQTMTMRPLGGILCFNVWASNDYAGEKVQSVTFLSEDSAAAGSFNFDIASESLSIDGLNEMEVSLDLEESFVVPSQCDKLSSLYMVVAPNVYRGTLTIETDVAVYKFVYNPTVLRNHYYTVNVNLANAAERTSLVPDAPAERKTAMLTYKEASTLSLGYNNPIEYENDYGKWTICAYKNNAFQLNKGKVAYIGTPDVGGTISSVTIRTTSSYSNIIYICASCGDNSAADIKITESVSGTQFTIYTSEAALSKLYIRSAAVCLISEIDIEYYASGNPMAVPAFNNLNVKTTAATSPAIADGTATISASITYNASIGSLASSSIEWKRHDDDTYTTVECGATTSPEACLTGLAVGKYDYHIKAVMGDGLEYVSDEASFNIRDNAAAVTSNYKYGWFELPVQTDKDDDGIDDDNSDYYYSHTFRADASTIRNFSACYSKGKLHPIWVAAPMHSCYLGSSGRNESYKNDPNIGCTQSPKYTGYTRGHMVGSSDRTVSAATNRQAFYYSNIGAQLSSGFNTGGGAWNNLEDKVDGYLCADTLYQVIGVAFQTWTDKYGRTIEAKTGTNSVGTFQVPTLWYKVLLRTKRGNTGKRVDMCSRDELQCVAFVLGHYSNQSHKPTVNDMYTVEDVEQLTGLTFFPNVPEAPKDTFSASDWGL